MLSANSQGTYPSSRVEIRMYNNNNYTGWDVYNDNTSSAWSNRIDFPTPALAGENTGTFLREDNLPLVIVEDNSRNTNVPNGTTGKKGTPFSHEVLMELFSQRKYKIIKYCR